MKKEHKSRNAALMARYGASSALMSKSLNIPEADCRNAILRCASRVVPITSTDPIIEEKAIAHAIKQAHAMHEESYLVNTTGPDYGLPEYALDAETCFMVACEQQGLAPHLWYVLYLASDWSNDITDWSNAVLAGSADEEFFAREEPCDEEADCVQSDEDADCVQSDELPGYDFSGHEAPYDAAAERLVNAVTADGNRHGVPRHTLAGLVAYRDEGLPVGDFLRAVLTNDLSETVCHADAMNLPVLADIVHWVHEYMPIASYGSEKNVKTWLKLKREAKHDV